jgi:hypothetical protein
LKGEGQDGAQTYETVFGQLVGLTGDKVADFVVHPVAMASEMHCKKTKISENWLKQIQFQEISGK